MADDLNAIDAELAKIECALVRALREGKAEADDVGSALVRLPKAFGEGVLASVAGLQSRLYESSDSGNLRLVCDLHDALRVRLIYIDNLLRHDIPRPYAELALREFQKSPHPPAAPGQAVTQPLPMRFESVRKGVFARLLEAVARLLGIGRGSASEPRQVPQTGKRAPAADTNPALEAEKRSEDELRLMYLHALIEDDELHLVERENRIKPLPVDLPRPRYVATFSARDFAENHFGARTSAPRQSIARTPEELRRKLAARAAKAGEGEQD